MATTSIEWTDDTWNATTGCDRVSDGCDNCYALTMAKRLKAMGSAKYQTDGDPRTSGPGFGVATHQDALYLPLSWRKPRKVFVNSMSDVFHDKVQAEFIAKMFAVMVAAPEHTFQVLTKRHARMRSLLRSTDFWGLVSTELGRLWKTEPPAPLRMVPPWIWLGVSVESQQWADIRIPALLDVPAAVRWLSCEPLLGSVDLSAWMPPGPANWQCGGCRRFFTGEHQETCPSCGRVGYWSGSHTGNGRPNGQPLSWVVAGGESGPDYRPLNLDWARSLRDQCTAASVPFLFKQHGGRTSKAGGRELDGQVWDEYPTPMATSESAANRHLRVVSA